MNRKISMIVGSCFVAAILFATNMETRTATDPNGYSYRYVTNDPFNGREYTLKNGLKVYLSRIPVKPRISFKLGIRGGFADSPANATGLAHYLEHMLFKGTSRIGALDYEKEKVLLDKIEQLFEKKRKTSDPKEKEKIYAEIDRLSSEAAKYAAAGEFSQLISSIGGSGLNASTSLNYTMYVVDIPSQELPKLLQLESERFRDPVMRLFHTELEAVYEEFNQGRDSDGRLLYEAMLANLFAPHPYSWIPLIGKPEHLKNPSITEITAFLKKYYVPSNMAIALAGDLDFDKTIALVDKYFSWIPTAPAPDHKLPKAAELTASKHVRISSPKSESLSIGFRVEQSRRNDLLGTILCKLLSNGSTGLMDSDLLQTQKVLSAYAGSNNFRDYSLFALIGRPKTGQTLDQLAELLLSELQKVRDGKFSEDLLKAAILNYRKGLIKARINPGTSTSNYMDDFLRKQDYAENLRMFDDMEKITKKEIMDFAKSLKYYVRADKITGKADSSGRVPKPKITPVSLNSDKNSAYGKEFLKQPPAPLPKLDVIDFKKDFTLLDLENGDRLFYSNKPSPVNDTLFTLQIYTEAGADHSPLLRHALGYLKYLGTQKYSLKDFRRELYKDALDFYFSCGAKRSSITLGGFASRMDRGLELADDFLRNMKPDEKAWQEYVSSILKERANTKKNQKSNFNVLRTYATYGSDPKNNPQLFANSLSEKELRKLTGKQMVELAKECFSKPRFYAYVGPDSIETVKKKISALTREKPGSRHLPEKPMKFDLQEVKQPRILLLPYDSSQCMVGVFTRVEKFSPDPVKMAKIRLFNQYFGKGGLNSVVFQELRESRSLAYYASASYRNSMEKGRYDFIFGYVATQPDKFFDAADMMLSLFRKMPLYPKKIEHARTNLLKGLSSSRTFGNLAGVWFQSEKTGIKRDLKPEIFAALQKITPQEIADFAAKELSGRNYDIFVVGPVEKLDRKKLKKYGKVQEVSAEQIFGY